MFLPVVVLVMPSSSRSIKILKKWHNTFTNMTRLTWWRSICWSRRRPWCRRERRMTRWRSRECNQRPHSAKRKTDDKRRGSRWLRFILTMQVLVSVSLSAVVSWNYQSMSCIVLSDEGIICLKDFPENFHIISDPELSTSIIWLKLFFSLNFHTFITPIWIKG